MTFEDRVRALTYLGFMPRQTRFVVTVALHSGFCLRRQFAAFADIEYGKNVRNFLDHLVDRQLARRLQFEINRGHVYHLSARAVYRAIGQDDNRNRRASSPALIARKLMLLDFAGPGCRPWLVTEQTRSRFTRSCTSRRPIFRETRLAGPAPEPPTRYFVNKLPIFLSATPKRCTSSFSPPLVSAVHGSLGSSRTLRQAAALGVVMICPGAVDLQTWRTAFAAFVNGSLKPKAATRSRTSVVFHDAPIRGAEHLPALSVRS
jgi:hypothetical protein